MEKKTPLYECHVNQKGKIVPFAGYLLPVQYETGVITEHMAVRLHAGLFDVSHMGEVVISGKDALENLQMLLTNDFSKMKIGQVKYSPMCSENGGVVDDLLVYKQAEDKYLLVVNASNLQKDVEWIKSKIYGQVYMEDISEQIAQIAIQGPKSEEILRTIAKEKDIPVKYYTFLENCQIGHINALISRTGYTGEDGFEIYIDCKDAQKLWETLLDKGKKYGLIPCGLGARDTLRLEASMPLYGHEMDENTSPLETGLEFAVKLDKEYFVGEDALISCKPTRKRIGLKIIERGIARENCPVYLEEVLIGHTTSGTFSPYYNYPIAMAIVNNEVLEGEIFVEIRGKRVKASLVDIPFYKRSQI
ncbi:MAG: gcvT [Anaerocolumna sp.]|jgi:aminomethyltransferase|nr:gcvT [Anaerocolumna sp.]